MKNNGKWWIALGTNRFNWYFFVIFSFFTLFPPCPLNFQAAAAEQADSETLDKLLAMSLEELVEVTIATDTPKSIKTAPAIASVITAEDIEKIGATTLDQALETVPGLHVFPNGVNLMETNWSIRGIQSGLNPHVLLLINGVPLRSLLNGNRIYGLQMPVSLISRIEVIRGPGSAVHGADAFAGTINVITKDALEIGGTEAGIRYGSFESSDIWLQHGETYRGWDLVAGLDWHKSEGDEDRIISRDGLGSGPPSLAPAPLDTHNETFDTHLSLSRGNWIFRYYGSIIETGMGHGGAQILSEDSEIDSKFFLGDLVYQKDEIIPDLDLNLKGYTVYQYVNNFFDFYPDSAGINAIGNPMGTEWQSGFEAAGLYHGFADHRLRIAWGIAASDVNADQYKNFGPGVPAENLFGELVSLKDTPYIYVEDHNRSNWYFSLQDEWAFAEKWELTAGLRYDHYSDFGSTTNPRLALVWEASERLTTKLMYGRSFRPPSIGELYFQNNPLTIGNPSLEPETIDTYELAMDYHPFGNLHTQLNVFTYEIEGLIEYVADPSAPATHTAQNYKDQEGHGFELEMDWQAMENLRCRGHIAYQRSEDKRTGEIVPDVPGLQLYANVHWLFLPPDWSLDGQYFWIGDRHRARGDTRPEIDDYDLVNLTLRRKNIVDNFDLSLAVRNLFDEDAKEPSPVPGLIPNDYPLENRSFWVELRYFF